jgi:hypothetical protein
MSSDFDSPEYECDLILKGGITSGIVYPAAITELAKSHKIRDIAGTSAGAIGAAAAAAAEVGRHSRSGGFPLLASLPEELKAVDSHGQTKLFRLFQPQPETRPFFDIVWAVRAESGHTRWRTAIGGVLQAGPMYMLALSLTAASVVGLVAVVLGVTTGGATTLWLSIPLLIALASLACVIALITVLVLGGLRMWSSMRTALAANFHGFVNGSTPPGRGEDTALTDWLYETLQRLAGRGDPGNDALKTVPVTYGEVVAAGSSFVSLTTNLSRGTSDQIPFHDQIWAFHPSDMEALFPDDVVRHLVDMSVTDPDPEIVAALKDSDLHLLPAPEDLPIIIGARMSLSFPVLLSAVPLYGLTFVRGDGGWRKVFQKDWFSDGGITSNLPVHLFDSPLPSRPTYAINLGGGADPAADPWDNVHRPIESGAGRLPSTSDITSTLNLLGAVFDTMQNWSDNNLSRVAGFRERICTVRLGKHEGGMNLDMSPSTIEPLVDRGRSAGRNLASMRTADLTDTGIEESAKAKRQWDRHRWSRFRIATSAIANLVEDTAPVYKATPDPPEKSYPDLGVEATGDAKVLPHRSSWSEIRNTEVARAWQAIFGLGGTNIDRLKGGPKNVGLSFGASSEPGPVASQPPQPPELSTR